MKRLSLICFFIFCSFLFGKIDIEKENRVKNASPGFCAWCSLETLANHHNIKALKGITKDRMEMYKNNIFSGVKDNSGVMHIYPANDGNESVILTKLEELKVKFYMSNERENMIKLMEYAEKNNLGCVFVLTPGWNGKIRLGKVEHHAMTMIEFGDNVKFIDSNDPSKIYSMKKANFLSFVAGYVVVIVPNKK